MKVNVNICSSLRTALRLCLMNSEFLSPYFDLMVLDDLPMTLLATVLPYELPMHSYLICKYHNTDFMICELFSNDLRPLPMKSRSFRS